MEQGHSATSYLQQQTPSLSAGVVQPRSQKMPLGYNQSTGMGTSTNLLFTNEDISGDKPMAHSAKTAGTLYDARSAMGS